MSTQQQQQQQQPNVLKQVLATTPLFHLIPRQHVAPLINLPSLVPQSDEGALNKHVIHSIESFDSESAKKFEQECQQELLNFTDPELDSIKFKVSSSHTKKHASPYQYSGFDAQILRSESIERGNIVPKTSDEIVKTGRLSIRKRAPTGDDTYVPKHNQKYYRKFEKEYMRLNPTQEVVNSGASEDEFTPIVSIKPESNLMKLNFRKFNQFLHREQQNFTWEDMVVICEILNKIDTFSEEDAGDLLKVLDTCYRSLSKVTGQLQNTDIKHINDIKSIIPELLCGIFASKASLIIIKYNISKGVQMAFGRYTIVIIRVIECVYELFLLPLRKISSVDTDEKEQKLFYKLITETSNRLRQFSLLSGSIEEQTLTKLEILCINLIFGTSLNDELPSLVPIDSLQTSASLCLIAIYKNTADQRTFLLHEVLTGFSSINPKKGEAKKFKTKRGFDIHYFTMILNNFSFIFIESEGYSSDFMDHVARALIEKVQGNATELRPKLSCFISDLLQMAYLPEWPTADLFLTSIASTLIQVLSSPEDQVPGETQFLDILQDLAENVLGTPCDNPPMGEKEMLSILGNSREFGTGDVLPCLRIKLQTLAGFTLTLDSELVKNHDTLNPGYKSLILVRLREFFTIKYLNFLETQIGSPRAKARAKSIKGLLVFVSNSPQSLQSAQLQKQLSSRLQDSAASVRDAMHEFLNSHIKKNPDEAEKLIQPMYLAMDDPSVSVKKRSIQSCMAVFSLVSEAAKLQISAKILEKIFDQEDSVRNEAVLMLKNRFLFQPPAVNLVNPGVLDVIRIGKSKGTKLLSSFFKEYVFTDSKAVGFVGGLILSAVELVENADDVEGGMFLLSMLSQIDPSLITQDVLVELKSFYLEEANINTSAYTYALEILKTTTSHLAGIRPEFSLEIQSFLLSKIINFHQRDMLSTISALWNLSRLSSTESKIANAVVGTLKWVRKSYNDKNYKQLPKLLQLLGCFGRLIKLQLFQHIFVKEGLMSEGDNVMTILFKHILTFTKPEFPPTLRKYALSNLVLACSSQPRLITHNAVTTRILDAIRSEAPNVKCAIIQNLNIYLDDHGTIDANTPSTTLESIQGVGNLQQNVCKSLVEIYFEDIIGLCTSNDLQLVSEAFLFVRMSLEMGFANPIKGISMAVALQGSPILTLQKAAHELYKYLFDKYRPLMDSQFGEGIKLAYSTGQIARNMFALLYEVVLESKMSRNKFIKSVSKYFVVKPRSSHLDEDLKFILFVIERMSLIKFETVEEVYIILHQLQQVLQNYAPDYINDLREAEVGDENTSDLGYLIYSILDYYNFLCAKYGITSENIDGFSSRLLEIDFSRAPTVVSSPILHVEWIFSNMRNLESLKFVVKEIRKSIFVSGE
ncbi:SCC2 [Candida theae]|uniref:Sister chromatid cohesion protein n=1 Tax=Candida theae TaxID=1198502 RepID=A0AAD5FYX0_9ASCO|nr:SCC2 [Candida theae]KAI5958539.1 SCC2 [Candida theae]